MSLETRRVALQPAHPTKNPDRTNFSSTIARPVDFWEHADVIEERDLNVLSELFESGSARMWGVMPKKSNRNRKQFDNLKAGDAVLFAGANRIYFSGTVVYKWVCPELAERLWGADQETGQTWEFMYAIMHAAPEDIPLARLRPLLKWDEHASVRGFQVLNLERSQLVLEEFDLETTEVPIFAQTPTGPEATTVTFEGALEATVTRQVRREQAKLRGLLLPGTTGTCALCGHEFPVKLLVAAHIKKRAHCSDSEKADLVNVAMRACKFGCDDLFEHGYITVAPGGRIEASYQSDDSPVIAEYISTHLAGRTISAWTPENEPYFDWHRANIFRKDVRPQ